MRRAGPMLSGAMLVALGCVVASGCSVLFRDDDLVGGRPSGSSALDGSDGALVEAGSDVDCNVERRTCACEKHDFCDDFDTEGEALGARWSGIPGLSNPLLKGEAGIELSDAGFTAPRGIAVTAFATTSSAYAVLGHSVAHADAGPSRPFGGVRVAMKMKVETLSFTEIRGPVPDAGSAVVCALTRFDGLTASGVAILAAERGIYLFASQDVLEANRKDASPEDVVIELYDGSPRELSESWVRIEIVVAERDTAVREGIASCASVGAGPVLAARLGPGTPQRCVALPPSFGGLSWAASAVLTAGAALYGGGELVVRQDDVTLDLFEE